MHPKIKKYLTAGLTFSAALGIGTVMQYGDALADRFGGESASPALREVASDPQLVVKPVRQASVGIPTGLPDFQMTGVSAQTPDVTLPAEISAPSMIVPQMVSLESFDDPAKAKNVAPETMSTEPQSTPAQQVDCKPTLTAKPLPLAMVDLNLEHACQPESVVTIHHQGMMFQMMTDTSGKLAMTVPALSSSALFVADFDTGPGAAATATVDDLADVDRAVLQWQGDADVQLHALEFGATYFEPGHIWAKSVGDPSDTLQGRGGVLTRLGDPMISDALLAEVYTFPSGSNARDGSVALSLEAEVTPRNCGREVAAQSIQLFPHSETDAVDLVMTMPGCESVGEFLVLKNMFEDLTLAAR